MGAFLEGLSEAEIVVGRDVTIEYRWAEGQYDRLPALAASLVQRQVSVIAALTTPSAVAAKAATGTIPIVFSTIGDPVQIGLVASLRRPGGNITGVDLSKRGVGPKLLELLHEVVPTATTVAALVNPTNPNAEILSNSLQVAAAHARARTPRPESEHRARYRHRVRNSNSTAGRRACSTQRRFHHYTSRNSSLRWRFATGARDLPNTRLRGSWRSDELRGQRTWTRIDRLAHIPAVFSRARNLPICRSSRPPRWS